MSAKWHWGMYIRLEENCRNARVTCREMTDVCLLSKVLKNCEKKQSHLTAFGKYRGIRCIHIFFVSVEKITMGTILRDSFGYWHSLTSWRQVVRVPAWTLLEFDERSFFAHDLSELHKPFCVWWADVTIDTKWRFWQGELAIFLLFWHSDFDLILRFMTYIP